MDIFELFKMALRNIKGSKMRSFLTMLGVIIGIFSVITLVTIGEGLKGYVYDQINSMGMGANYLEIHAGKKAGMMMFGGKITYQDAKAIEARAKHVVSVDPRIVRPGKFYYGKNSFSSPMVMGVTPNMVDMFNWNVAHGKFITDVDVDMRKRVCVLGKTAAEKLFGGFSPLSERVRMDGKSLTVIGVMDEFGSLMGISYDDFVIVPVTSAADLFGMTKLIEIGVLARSEEETPAAVEEIKEILIKRHGQEDFRIDIATESMAMLDTVMNALTGIVSGIAAISLLVGGIGIMNIMLVAVTERTREIGVRKAVGAKEKDIVMQFLAESVIISFLGGVIGILAAVGFSSLIMKAIGFPFRLSYTAVILATSVSLIVGVLSGVYPARRAGRLDPVEALRYE